MKKLIYKYPVVSSVVIVSLFLILSRLMGELWVFGNGAAALLAYEALHILLPFAFVLLFGDKRVYKKGNIMETLTAGGYMAISQILLFSMMFFFAFTDVETKWVEPVWIIYGIVMLFGIGFREESIFRGIVAENIAKKYAKSRKGMIFTAAVSGIIFGLIHMTNVFAGGDIASVTIQSVVAVGVGFYLTAVYLRGGSLWALIIMHTIADAASLFLPTFTENNGTAMDAINNITIMNLSPFFIMTSIGLYLLRKEKCEEILAENKTTE